MGVFYSGFPKTPLLSLEAARHQGHLGSPWPQRVTLTPLREPGRQALLLLDQDREAE